MKNKDVGRARRVPLTNGHRATRPASATTRFARCSRAWSSSTTTRSRSIERAWPELAAKERGEIAVIERFLPKQLDDAGIEAAVKAAIAETGAASIDTGKVMGVLKQNTPARSTWRRRPVRKLLGT